MKTLIHTLFIIALSLQTQALWAETRACQQFQMIQSEITQQNNDLRKLRDLHRLKLQAEEIKSQLLNSESEREILILAERIEEQVNEERGSRTFNATGTGVSIGAIMLSSYFLRKISSGTQGLALKDRIIAQVKPTGQGALVRTLINSTLFMSVVGTLWLGYRVTQNQSQISHLGSLIDQLNELRDLSSQIRTLDDHLEEMSIQLELMQSNHEIQTCS